MADRVLLGDVPVNNPDGADWYNANMVLRATWRNPGGDYSDADGIAQGPNPFAVSSTVRATGDKTTMNVAALVSKLLADNTGIYILGTGSAHFASRDNTTLPPPKMTVNGAVCPILVDCWISKSDARPIGYTPHMDPPMLLKFDLSGIASVQSATLELSATAVYSPATLKAFLLDMPSLVNTDPVELGLAATVGEAALASHPDVLVYLDMTSREAYKANTDMWANTGGNDAAYPPVRSTRELELSSFNGIPALIVWSTIGDVALRSDHIMFTPNPYPPLHPWQHAWAQGVGEHKELWLRYLVEIGEDVADGAVEGIKTPGFCGTYGWAQSNYPTLLDGQTPSPFKTWESRNWMTSPSKTNRHWYHWGVYHYGPDHPADGSGQGLYMTKGYVRAGRPFCVDQHIKMNTVVNGVAQPDGVEDIWIDGRKVSARTNMQFIGDARLGIQEVFINWFHGGRAPAIGRFHIKYGGIVVARRYIGPPNPETLPPPTGGTVAQLTIYNNDPANVTVTVINGNPPDQSEDLAALQARFDTYVAAVRADAQASKDADAAKVDGQSLLDIVP